ncbi:glycosyltransferase family 25 protein [uncultured Parabacteroides sp.]|uniref:glycosyltransferase family 25 protein n=1 Tax=uncultured Parabacteroides sp. TaxID=512312 RepID=UPI00259B898B|nr:glycosyltransferase family 25 protein [uncultured Parabacteroides sp.]
MEQIKTYVINLPKDLDRRESILKETGRYLWLDVEIVKAVYGKDKLDYTIRKKQGIIRHME